MVEEDLVYRSVIIYTRVFLDELSQRRRHLVVIKWVQIEFLGMVRNLGVRLLNSPMP
jgi:hypothetical protein